MSASSLYQPQLAAIARIEEETPDTRTYFLAADGIEWRRDYEPGQFVELSVFGVGEAPVLPRPEPDPRGVHRGHRAADRRRDRPAAQPTAPGDVVGLRGPFGNSFPFERARGKNLIFVGGGIGLPPLRSLINFVLDRRDGLRPTSRVLYGARTPADRVYKKELAAWANRRRSRWWRPWTAADETLDRARRRGDEAAEGHARWIPRPPWRSPAARPSC